MTTKKSDYQSLSAELQAVIDWFEGDDLNLDEAAAKYEKALELIKQTEEYLKNAENKIKKINTKFGS